MDTPALACYPVPLTDASEGTDLMDETPPRSSKSLELKAFLFLSVVMAPVLAVIVVSGYGFLVWMFQLSPGRPARTSDPPCRSKSCTSPAWSCTRRRRRLQRVAEAHRARMPGARVHASSPAGKLVVTLEAASADEMTVARWPASSAPTACCPRRWSTSAPTAWKP